MLFEASPGSAFTSVIKYDKIYNSIYLLDEESFDQSANGIEFTKSST